MAKFVVERPDWLKAENVSHLYSVSNCNSHEFADYVDHWAHNGFWLFDTPAGIVKIAEAEGVDLSPAELLYYEIHEQEYDELADRWDTITPHSDFTTEVQVPENRTLLGFDVASFSAGLSPECSPLSCNSIAEKVSTNSHCLLNSLEEALDHLASGAFKDCEPGPYRVFAVYRTPWPEG